MLRQVLGLSFLAVVAAAATVAARPSSTNQDSFSQFGDISRTLVRRTRSHANDPTPDSNGAATESPRSPPGHIRASDQGVVKVQRWPPESSDQQEDQSSTHERKTEDTQWEEPIRVAEMVEEDLSDWSGRTSLAADEQIPGRETDLKNRPKKIWRVNEGNREPENESEPGKIRSETNRSEWPVIARKREPNPLEVTDSERYRSVTDRSVWRFNAKIQDPNKSTDSKNIRSESERSANGRNRELTGSESQSERIEDRGRSEWRHDGKIRDTEGEKIRSEPDWSVTTNSRKPTGDSKVQKIRSESEWSVNARSRKPTGRDSVGGKSRVESSGSDSGKIHSDPPENESEGTVENDSEEIRSQSKWSVAEANIDSTGPSETDRSDWRVNVQTPSAVEMERLNSFAARLTHQLEAEARRQMRMQREEDLRQRGQVMRQREEDLRARGGRLVQVEVVDEAEDQERQEGRVGRSWAADEHQEVHVVKVAVPEPVPVAVPQPVPVAVPHPVPVRVRVAEHIEVPVVRTVAVPVETPVPVKVEHIVPYPVEKHVPVPVEKHVPYPVHEPYPVKVPVVKTIHHYVKKKVVEKVVKKKKKHQHRRQQRRQTRRHPRHDRRSRARRQRERQRTKKRQRGGDNEE